MDRYKARIISAPQIRSDGKAIELQLIADDGTEISVAIPTSDMLTLVRVVVRAYQTAKTRGTMLSEVENASEKFEPTPLLVDVRRFGFVTQPSDDVGLLVVLPLAGPEVHIRFGWPQLRALVERIEALDNVQSADADNTAPS